MYKLKKKYLSVLMVFLAFLSISSVSLAQTDLKEIELSEAQLLEYAGASDEVGQFIEGMDYVERYDLYGEEDIITGLRGPFYGTILLGCLADGYEMDCGWTATVVGDQISSINLTLMFQKNNFGTWSTVNQGTFSYHIGGQSQTSSQLERDLTYYGTGHYRGAMSGSLVLTTNGTVYPTLATSVIYELPN